MSQKRWSGRFSSAMAPEAVRYGASIPFDHRLAPYDLVASQAYAQALRRAGLLTQAEARRIRDGLKAVAQQIESGKLAWREDWEDIHTHIERALIEKIGAVGGKLHTGRSRNDQVATDLRLYCLDQLTQLAAGLQDLQGALLFKAESWDQVLIPGYTHLQRAQPVLLAHHLLAYVEMLSRDEERVQEALKRTAVLPLGSGALAGHAFSLDRQALATDLGFREVARNSLDAVSDRDFAVEIAAVASLIMIHLSRLAEELILWSSSEFGFLNLPEAYCTGSSMMPQKVNPDIPELIRGKSGRVIGDLTALLTMLKGLPLAYNKDLQEDKEPLFDIFDTLLPTLSVLSALLRQVQINEAALKDAAADEAMLATDVADWLVRQSVPFREAHEITAKIVREAIQKVVSIKDLPLATLKRFSPKITKELYRQLDPAKSVAKRDAIGGTARKNVRREIRRHRKRLG